MAHFLFVCVFSTLQDDPGHLSADRNQICRDPHFTEHLEQVNEREEQIAEESTMVVVSSTRKFILRIPIYSKPLHWH